MTTKNPFEIRYDVLKLANDYFENIANANIELAKQAFAMAVADNRAKPDDWQKFVPQVYTLEEVLKKAEELYKFVSTK